MKLRSIIFSMYQQGQRAQQGTALGEHNPDSPPGLL